MRAKIIADIAVCLASIIVCRWYITSYTQDLLPNPDTLPWSVQAAVVLTVTVALFLAMVIPAWIISWIHKGK